MLDRAEASNRNVAAANSVAPIKGVVALPSGVRRAVWIRCSDENMENQMLTLDLPVEPYWLALPRGVRVEIRPVTTAVMAAAQTASARRLSALRAAEPELDPDMARGLAFAFLVKALARHAILAWEGIGDTAGKPLPLSPDAVERLMDLDDIAAAFWDRATAPVAAAAMEGNA
jgi:hypothetical protein